jgi:hypothetical protein
MKLPSITRPVIAAPKIPARPPAPLPARLAAITRPDMVQIAPGKYAPTSDQVPEMTVCAWQKTADGHYHPVPVAERWIRLDEDMLRILGFRGDRPRPDTLLRLGRAGFIEVIQATPKCHMLNLDSWFNHLRRCAEDPFFWEDEARIDEYRKSL